MSKAEAQQFIQDEAKVKMILGDRYKLIRKLDWEKYNKDQGEIHLTKMETISKQTGIDMNNNSVQNVKTPNENQESMADYVDSKIDGKKIQKTFTINDLIYENFRSVCDKGSINMSKFIENSMLNLINKENNEKNMVYLYTTSSYKKYVINAVDFEWGNDFVLFLDENNSKVAKFKDDGNSSIIRINKKDVANDINILKEI
jgi:hypothetical protein